MIDKMDGVRAMWLAVIFFALGHTAVKWVPHIPFYQLVFLRAVQMAIICIVVLRIKKVSIIGRNKKLLFYRGLAGTIALTTYFYSLQHMPLASAVTIQYLSPVFTLILAHFFLREKTGFWQWVCFSFAFIGVLMVKGFDTRVSGVELMISFLSVIFSAIAYNLVRVLKDFDDEFVVVLYFTAVTVPVIGPFAIMNWVSPSLTDWFFILLMGVLTQLAQIFMTIAYQRRPASEVAIYNYTGVFIALGMGYMFFDEAYELLSLFGMLTIMVAVFASSRVKTPLKPASLV